MRRKACKNRKEIVLMALTVMIKPCGSSCNLHCEYCFFKPINNNVNFMSSADTEILLTELLSIEKNYINILFQGGEPTLIGLDFYKNFVAIADKLKGSTELQYSLQTNGISLDRTWTKFFKENNFLIGLSLDGDKNINDKVRKHNNGSGTYTEIVKTVKLLQSDKVEFNILAVISKVNVKSVERIYKFYKKLDLKYLQFTMPVCYSQNNDLLPDNTEMADFLIKLFELWHSDFISGNYISIRFFDNLILKAAGKNTEQCGMNGKCGKHLVIDSNLDCYPCDFYSNDNYKLGNLRNTGLQEIWNGNTLTEFIGIPSDIPQECNNCRHFDLCSTGCKRYRHIDINAEYTSQFYCEAYSKFFDYSKEKIYAIAQKII